MPLIITPRQLERRAELYHQLGVLLSAGLTMHQGLEQLRNNPPDRALRPKITEWLDYLRQGFTVSNSVQKMGQWMPSFDLALIEAGEQSGRLDACFKLLAVHYGERARMVKQAINDLLYPIFTLHVAVILFPFTEFLLTGNATAFFLKVFGVLVPLYALVFFVIVACQGRHGENWRALLERTLHPVPVLGTARRDLALARLAAALEALLNAGVPIIGAWELAATASGSPALRRSVMGWKPLLEHGSTPSELVSDSGQFPTVFANLYHTGEISGQLDETLKRMHTMYMEEGMRRMKMVAQWGPRLVYFGVVIFCAYRIVVGFYNADIKPLKDVMDFK
jgi:type II secretory pathway component PulF